MTSLFEKYSANSFKDLDYAMKNDPDVLYGKSLKFYFHSDYFHSDFLERWFLSAYSSPYRAVKNF